MTTPALPTVPAQSAVPRALTILLCAASVVVVVTGMTAVAWLIGPLFLALVIVICISPVQRWARRHGWPGWLSTLLLVVLVYSVILSLVAVVVLSVSQLVTLLPTYSAQMESITQSVTAVLQKFGVDPSAAKITAGTVDMHKLATLTGSLLSSVSGVLSSVIFILALLLFLSAEAGGAGVRLAAIAADRQPVAAALEQFAQGTRSYFVVTTVFGAIVAILDTIGLAFLGVPLAVMWGVLAFITNYIPNVGFLLGLIPPAILGLLTGGWTLCLWVIVMYCVLNVVIQSLIQPRFVGDSVGLSATVTFVALIFWAWVLGGLGALLAIPMTLLVKALLVDTDPRAAWVNDLIRSPDRPKKERPSAADSNGAVPAPRTEARHGAPTVPTADQHQPTAEQHHSTP